MPIIHPNSAYPHISSLRNHWIHALSGRISLNTNWNECRRSVGSMLSGNEQAVKHFLAGLIHIMATEYERDVYGYAGNGDINSRSRYGAQIRLSALYASICYIVCLL
jgi:hypothetical protein